MISVIRVSQPAARTNTALPPFHTTLRAVVPPHLPTSPSLVSLPLPLLPLHSVSRKKAPSSSTRRGPDSPLHEAKISPLKITLSTFLFLFHSMNPTSSPLWICSLECLGEQLVLLLVRC